MNKTTRNVVYGGIVACLYAVLTLMPGLNSLAYGPIQFRVSELLTILPLFTASAVPGLAIGCVAANMASPMILDMVFGTLATLFSAYCTYKLRKHKKIALMMPVVFNAVIIGTMLSFFYSDTAVSLKLVLINMFKVGAGEFVICFVIGYPLSLILEKRGFLQKNNGKNE